MTFLPHTGDMDHPELEVIILHLFGKSDQRTHLTDWNYSLLGWKLIIHSSDLILQVITANTCEILESKFKYSDANRSQWGLTDEQRLQPAL